MRLTLRTMLAYLDQMLSPEEAQQIGEKIKTREFATKLVQFIRAGLRSNRIEAPAADADQPFADANDVAEYLDDTLDPQRVTELERYCLEHEGSLIEVAACHRMVSQVVAKQVSAVTPSVSPALRQRVYGLAITGAAGWEASRPAVAPTGGNGHPQDPAPAQPVVETAPAATTFPAATLDLEPAAAGENQPDDWNRDHQHIRPRELPDYMKPRPTRAFPWQPILASAAMTVLLGVVAMRALGPFDAQHPVLGVMFADALEVVQADGSPRQETGDAVATGDAAETGQAGNPPDADSAAAPPTGMSYPEPPFDDPPSTPTTDEGLDAAPPVPPAATGNPGQASDDAPPNPAAGPSDGEDAPPLPPATDGDGETPAVSTPPANENAPSDAARWAPVRPGPADDVAPAEPAPPVRDLGQVRGAEHVLARWNPEIRDWNRVRTRQSVRAGERFFVPPAFHPEVVLSNGVLLMIAGPAEFILDEAPDAPELIRLTLLRGRFHLDGVAGAAPSLRLDLGPRVVLATFAGADSAVSIDVKPYLPVGSDPKSRRADIVSEIIVDSGRVLWREADSEVDLAAGQGRRSVNLGPAEPFEAEPPEWISPKSEAPIERIAIAALEPELIPERPLSLILQEQSNNRRVEVQSLCQRSLAYLANYGPLVESFSNRDMHGRWTQHFETLQESLAVGPAFIQALERQLMMFPEGARLYRLALGFSSDQLDAANAKQLVEDLQSENMTVRVLALENLRRITGKTYSFRPDYSPRERPGQIGRWRKALENGEIK